jgi:hypothetical protein
MNSLQQSVTEGLVTTVSQNAEAPAAKVWFNLLKLWLRQYGGSSAKNEGFAFSQHSVLSTQHF